MERTLDKMTKFFWVVLALTAILWLAWLFWPQTLAPTIPEPQASISTLSFSETRQESTLSHDPAPPSESVPETIPSVLTSGRDFDVPHGAILPAILLDNGSSDENKIADGLLVSLEEEFFKELQEAKSKGGTAQEIWEELRSKYDEKYTALFGQEAYMEATNLAADEAREDFDTPASPH
jgi:hypothetical protein